MARGKAMVGRVAGKAPTTTLAKATTTYKVAKEKARAVVAFLNDGATAGMWGLPMAGM